MSGVKMYYTAGASNKNLYPYHVSSNEKPTVLDDNRFTLQNSIINVGTGSACIQYVSDNTIHTWGVNKNGVLGVGVSSSSYTSKDPLKVSGYRGVAKKILTSEEGVVFVLNEDGTLYHWGKQYGLTVSTPTKVKTNVSDIFCNNTSSGTSIIALDNITKKVYGWGTGEGVFGINSPTIKYDFEELTYLSSRYTEIKDITIGSNYSFVVYVDGSVDYCGNGANYQTGVNTTHSPTSFTSHPYLRNVYKIFTGKDISFAITNDDKVYVWGYDKTGYASGLGLGEGYTIKTPTEIPELSGKGVKNIATSNSLYSFMANTDDGNTYVWGLNTHGELGLVNNTLPVPTPIINTFFEGKLLKPQFDPNGSSFLETELKVSIEMISTTYPNIEFYVKDNYLDQADSIEVYINGDRVLYTADTYKLFDEQSIIYTMEDRLLNSGMNDMEIRLYKGLVIVERKIFDVDKVVSPIQPKDGMTVTIADEDYQIVRVVTDSTGLNTIYLNNAVPIGVPNKVKIPFNTFIPTVTYSYNDESKTTELLFVKSRRLDGNKIESKYELTDIVFDKCTLKITSDLTTSTKPGAAAKLTNPMMAFQYFTEKI